MILEFERLPNVPCVFVIADDAGRVFHVGETDNLSSASPVRLGLEIIADATLRQRRLAELLTLHQGAGPN